MTETIGELHVKLATYYRKYPGRNAPSNYFTERLWLKIEAREAAKRRERAR